MDEGGFRQGADAVVGGCGHFPSCFGALLIGGSVSVLLNCNWVYTVVVIIVLTSSFKFCLFSVRPFKLCFQLGKKLGCLTVYIESDSYDSNPNM